MARVELDRITKRFGRVTALDDVSLVIQDGEFFSLLGPSGAGKSTLINIIAGIQKPDTGAVVIDGTDITKTFPQQRDIATAFESFALYPHLTVRQNLMFPLEAPDRKRATSNEWREQRVHEIASMLALDELLHRYPRELSGGQKQRVALGRTLVRKPKAYLLDEPISHLDAKLRHRMRSELRKIQQDLKITTLYATPDQLEALSMGDRVAVLNEGRVEQEGTTDEIYYRPLNLFVAQFVGDPPMNIFDAELQGDELRVCGETFSRIALPVQVITALKQVGGGGRLKIGFRPTDIRLVPPGSGRAHIRGEVILADTHGQTSIITIRRAGDDPIKLKMHADQLPALRSLVGMDLLTDRMMFFHPESGVRIDV